MSLRYSKNRKTAVGLEKKVGRDRVGEVGRLSPSKDVQGKEFWYHSKCVGKSLKLFEEERYNLISILTDHSICYVWNESLGKRVEAGRTIKG